MVERDDSKITAPELTRDATKAALQLAIHKEYRTEIEARKKRRVEQLIIVCIQAEVLRRRVSKRKKATARNTQRISH